MYSTILVPVSFEEDRDSEASLRVAKLLCAPSGTITLLHVIEHVPDYATTYLPSDFRQKQAEQLQAALQDMAACMDNARIALVEGHAGRTIVDHAKSSGSDCIVVASHKPGMQDLLLGSTATHVVRHAPCSVHVLR